MARRRSRKKSLSGLGALALDPKVMIGALIVLGVGAYFLLRPSDAAAETPAPGSGLGPSAGGGTDTSTFTPAPDMSQPGQTTPPGTTTTPAAPPPPAAAPPVISPTLKPFVFATPAPAVKPGAFKVDTNVIGTGSAAGGSALTNLRKSGALRF